MVRRVMALITLTAFCWVAVSCTTVAVRTPEEVYTWKPGAIVSVTKKDGEEVRFNASQGVTLVEDHLVGAPIDDPKGTLEVPLAEIEQIRVKELDRLDTIVLVAGVSVLAVLFLLVL